MTPLTMNLLVLFLSLVICYLLWQKILWQGFTAAANRRRKAMESNYDGLLKDYDRRGTALDDVVEMRRRALAKITELCKELGEKDTNGHALRASLSVAKRAADVLTSMLNEKHVAHERLKASLLDKERQLAKVSREFLIEQATVKAQRRELDAAGQEVVRMELRTQYLEQFMSRIETPFDGPSLMGMKFKLWVKDDSKTGAAGAWKPVRRRRTKLVQIPAARVHSRNVTHAAA